MLREIKKIKKIKLKFLWRVNTPPLPRFPPPPPHLIQRKKLYYTYNQVRKLKKSFKFSVYKNYKSPSFRFFPVENIYRVLNNSTFSIYPIIHPQLSVNTIQHFCYKKACFLTEGYTFSNIILQNSVISCWFISSYIF